MLCLPRCPPLLSPALSVYLCANVGLQGLLVVRLPALFVPHSASLGPATATRVLSAPPAHLCPSTGVDECLFFIYLVSDFLAVQFSVSSGCGRRRSVSTYASILVLQGWYSKGSLCMAPAFENKFISFTTQAQVVNINVQEHRPGSLPSRSNPSLATY